MLYIFGVASSYLSNNNVTMSMIFLKFENFYFIKKKNCLIKKKKSNVSNIKTIIYVIIKNIKSLLLISSELQ